MKGVESMKKVSLWARVLVVLLAMAMLFTACSQSATNSSSSSSSETSSSEASSTNGSSSSEAAESKTETASKLPDPVDFETWNPKERYDLSKPAELNVIFAGDMQIDYPEVEKAFNEKMSELINTTVKVTFLTWADTYTKYPLMLASGEQIDIAFGAAWLDYQNLCYKGAFQPLQDYIDEYMPITKKELDPFAWKEATINGNIYMIPADRKVIYGDGFVIRGDLREKYNIPEINSWETLEQYLKAIKDNEPGMIPWDVGGQDIGTGYGFSMQISNFNGTDFFYMDDPEMKVVTWAEQPEYKEYIERMYDWANKGFWSKGVLSNKVSSRDAFKNGKSALAVMNTIDFNTTFATIDETNPEWKVEWTLVWPGQKLRPRPYIQGGTVVPSTAKDVTRSLIAIETWRNNKELYEINFYGIKGKHWTEDSTGVVSANDPNYLPGTANGPGGFFMDKWTRPVAHPWKDYDAWQERMWKDAWEYPLPGFAFNSDKVKNELAAVSSVLTEYALPLSWGVKDPGKGLPELIQALKDAGQEKINAERQAQIDAFKATLK